MTRAVLFQHGLGGDEAQVAQIWPDGVADRTTLNCRGHGGTPLGAERPFSIAMLAADALAAMPAPAFVAGGISMGAAIALRLACLHPGRVQALILIRPAWAFDPSPANMAPVAEIATLLRRLPPDRTRVEFAASAVGRRLAREAPDNLASLLGYCDRPDATAFAGMLADIAADGPGVSRAEAMALHMPCLIVANDHDHIHPVACAEALAAAIPGARLIHVAPKARDRVRHQAETRAAIAAFLSSLPEMCP